MFIRHVLFLLSALQSVQPHGLQTTTVMPSCCSTAVTDACRNYCQKMDHTLLHPADPELLLEMASHCPPSMQESFWNCLNITIGPKHDADYLGRQCCSLSPVHRCQTACLRAKQYSEDLASECRKSDNMQLFQCLNLIREGEECCSLSADSQCRKACSTVYSATATSASGAGINGTLRHAANTACSRSHNVLQCAKNLLKVDRLPISTSTLECCDKGKTFQCQETCRSALKAGEPDAVGLMVKDCGELLLTEPLWKCFMSKSPPSSPDRSAHNNDRAINDIRNSKPRSLIDPSKTVSTTITTTTAIQRSSYDAAKLSCCDRGTLQCYRLCRMAHTNEFFPETEELDNCVAQTSEAAVATCFEDVDEPCQPGCSNLSFCSSFNNRPLELFRNCNPEADAAAQNVFQEWIRMTRVVLPGLTGRQDVKLWGPSTCMMPQWKALACALQFKPCRRNMLRTAICWNSCIKLLSGCMTQYNATLAVELCNRLTPESFTGACISLEDYVAPQPKTVAVVAPCRYNTCRTDQVCVVDHRSSNGYSCLPGCQFGDRSKLLGFPKSWVQLPTPSTSCYYNSCNEVCYCNGKGELQQCHSPPLQPFEACRVGQQQFEHGTRLQNDCNQCVCHYGELICTRYRCDNSSGTSAVIWSCPLQPNPVCTSSGKRFLNTCVAQWHGTAVEPLEHCPQEGPDGFFAPECYTVIQLVYSQKQIDRLSRSTNKSTIFSASLVEQSLRYLLAYSHCHVSVFHSVDGELLAVIHSQMHCASCSAEAEKLVMLFDTRSPQVTLNVQLDVILLAEVVQFVQLHPSHTHTLSSGVGGVFANHVQSIYIIPFFLSLLRFI
uniref:Reversion-inducing cysteine-rich protein with Kazal motifs n=1 Tax=Daphnia galeata TaxID=27404 RepID=A0A8J2S5C7_9CRUS|nr:unnamed protein product [Daphnia galeata]